MKTDSMNSVGSLQLFIRDEAVRKGLIQPGHYGIPESDEKVIDLGVSVDLVPLARRPKAIDMSNPKAPIVSVDIDSKVFQRIVAMAGDPKSRCQYGISFLVYERSTGRFLEFFCGDKPSRIEAKEIFLCLPMTEADIAARRLVSATAHAALPLTLKVNRRGSWYFPQVAKCLTPVILPNWGIVDNRIAEFINEGSEEFLRRISQAVTRRAKTRIKQQTKASSSAAKCEGARSKQIRKKTAQAREQNTPDMDSPRSIVQNDQKHTSVPVEHPNTDHEHDVSDGESNTALTENSIRAPLDEVDATLDHLRGIREKLTRHIEPAKNSKGRRGKKNGGC